MRILPFPLVIVALGLLSSGCASGPPLGRDKQGATPQQFMADHYACLQESSSRVSGAAVNSAGGVASSAIACNYQMYDTCMNAREYYVVVNGRFQTPVVCNR